MTWAAGTTVDLYADNDRNSSDGLGTPIATNVPVTSGDNTFTWNGAGVTPGQYWITAVMHRGGISVDGTSTGVVDVGMNGSGPPPAVVPITDGPSQLQLFFFYVYLSQVKFFCGVARARGITAVSNQHICVLLIGPPAKAKKKR
jgi:hypothetical protein